MPSGVTVVGSANMDIVFAVDRIPQPGETLLADSAARYPGGKGLNQAVAAARAGAPTEFVGAVGDDEPGQALRAVMAEAGIATDCVRTSAAGTGQAFIVVDGSGENTIIVASGANATLTGLDERDRGVVSTAAVLLMQLELPIELVTAAAVVARSERVAVMLNAAPARQLSEELLDHLDYLIVNEHEACLLGRSDDLDIASGVLAGRVQHLVVTLGPAGSALYLDGAELARIAAPVVTAVDTVGAGDTFCGAFAAGVAEGMGFAHAAEFGTAAAALSVQAVGAVPSIPTRDLIELELAR